ncbi:MAG: DUF1887 family protein [Lachnospiraceae bacterium]|nr:DUF1887 family protein [Lachnospiraceae bacterium]
MNEHENINDKRNVKVLYGGEAAIQYHLYQYPLYRFLSDGDESLNILVVGFGNYGQKFLDICLQIGQIRKKNLRVTVISDDSADEERYLAGRPELADFYKIVDKDTKEDAGGEQENGEDGTPTDFGGVYGTIIFEVAKLERDNQKANADILENHVMCEHYDTHYVFIALGEDLLNQSAAKACESVVDSLELQCMVSYVQAEESALPEEKDNLCPVFVNEDVRKLPLYPEFERMAFNTHLIWEKSLNADYRQVRAEFRKSYNYYSCLSHVLSLKYKLYHAGIDLEHGSLEEAAKIFQEKVLGDGETCAELKNELIWMEHRRWVTEKLCKGWRRISNLRDCPNGGMKDERRKRHVCILPSSPNQDLAAEYKKNPDFWDKASESKLNKLDELDRMSVRLHRLFVKEAERVRKENLLNSRNFAIIRDLAEKDQEALTAFREWFVCLKDIWNGGSSKVWLYKGLKNNLLRAAENMADIDRKSIKEQIKALETRFYPVLASMEYRDYKLDDVALVENIPFVLTYTNSLYLAVPFVSSSDNSKIFQNVASATISNPARILYLCVVEEESDVQGIKETIPYVMAYLNRKHVRAKVEFVIALADGLLSCAQQALEGVEGQYKERIKQVKYITAPTEEEMPAMLEEYLAGRKKRRKAFVLERNKTALSALMEGAGIYRRFPNFRFDSAAMKFRSLSRCDLLGYISKSPYLTVADMVSLRRSGCRISRQPEFFAEYQELWEEYSKNPGTWKALCRYLGDYAEKYGIIASFKRKDNSQKEQEYQEYQYILPFSCRRSAAKVVGFLKENKFVEARSKVYRYTTDSCKIVIVDRCGCRKEYDRLFANIYALMDPDAIDVFLNTKEHAVKVAFDNLQVSDVSIEDYSGKCRHLLNFFQKLGYVINLEVGERNGNNISISFTYATRQIKELLTKGGRMLEVYLYHKVRESGLFDDVMSGFEIEWEDSPENKNEFDCILTKGFQTVFVECKAVKMMEQDYYYKLKVLAEHFGINVIMVMLRETQEKSYHDTAKLNKNQEERGKKLNIITVRKREEIEHIDETLLKIVNGTYAAED